MPSSSSASSPKITHKTRRSGSTSDERSSLLKHPIPQILRKYDHTHHSSSSSLSLPLSLPPTSSSKPSPAIPSGDHQLHQPGSTIILNSDSNQPVLNAYHLAGLVNDHGGEYEKYRVYPDQLKQMSSKAKKFYERQNEILDYFKEIDWILDSSRRRSSSGYSSPPKKKGSTEDEGDQEPGQRSVGFDLESNSIPNHHSSNLTNPNQRLINNNNRIACSEPVECARKLDRQHQESLSVKWTINVNFLINFLLLVGKILVALLSNSISLIASLVDSAMDFLSTAIIWWTNRKIDSKTWQSIWQYPAGKRRMEPMGVVIFSVFMISSFVQVLVESIERLLGGSKLTTISIPFTSMMVMLVTILVKGIVWLWCRRRKNTSIKALAQDAENDCILNIFSLLFPYLGLKFNLPRLDAVGGLILSLYIITEWTGTLFDNVKNLTGRRADPIQHQRVAYLVTRFSPLIQAVQHCHVYQAGDDLIVETDVILSPDTSLPVAHDVGESVQYALESLDGISRAYCHVDFSSNPMSGHFQR